MRTAPLPECVPPHIWWLACADVGHFGTNFRMRVNQRTHIFNVEYVMSPSPQRTAPSLEPTNHSATTPEFRAPYISDGERIWEIAKESATLDLNSSYAYVLWCHDFAATSVVAVVDDRPIGFVTGYRRPADPSTLMVWQVAVDNDYRGQRIAARMLHQLMDRLAPEGVTAMHTTISSDNAASQRLFESVAASRGLQFTRRDLFAPELFPDSHQPEDLYLLEPGDSRP